MEPLVGGVGLVGVYVKLKIDLQDCQDSLEECLSENNEKYENSRKQEDFTDY